MQAVFNVIEKTVSAIKQAEMGVTSEQKADAFASELEQLKTTTQPSTKKAENTSDKPADNTSTEAEQTGVADGKKLPTTTPSENALETEQSAPVTEASNPSLTEQSDSNIETDIADAAFALVSTDTDQSALAVAKQTVTEIPRSSTTMVIRADLADALSQQTKTPTDSEIVEPTLRHQQTATLLNQAQTDNASQKLFLPLKTDMTERLSTSLTTATPHHALSSSQTTLQPVATIANTQPVLTVQPHLNQPAWGQVMSSRVVWMASEGIQQAEIRLNPAQMGPVEVRLQLHHDQASVTFLAQQSATRDALEQALPRLRDSFAEAGLQLAHANVGEQTQQQHSQPEQKQNTTFFTQANPITVDTESETEQRQHSATDSVGLSLYA